MTKIKLLTTEGYSGLEPAVGKIVNAGKYLGHWNVRAEELEAHGCTVRMEEYTFLQREVEVMPCLTPGL